MKKIIYLSTIVALMLTSCDKTTDIEDLSDTNTVLFGGLKVCLPVSYDKSVLSLSLADLQNEFNASNIQGLSKVLPSESVSMTLDQMAILAEEAVNRYPNLDSITSKDIAIIKRDFVGLDEKSIGENIDVIDSFYTALSRYDLVKALSKENRVQLKAKKVVSSYYFGYEMNSSEFWFFVFNPSLAKPIKKATGKALDLTSARFPNSPKYQDKGDAFRHAIWSALIAKYIGESENSVADCLRKTREFTDKHESGGAKPENLTIEQFELDAQMDYHNNEQGRNYFGSVAWIVKEGWFKVKRVRAPTEDQMADAVVKLTNAAIKVSTVGNISSLPSNLVYLID